MQRTDHPARDVRRGEAHEGDKPTEGDGGRYDEFLAKFRSATTPQEEQRYLYALAAFQQSSLLSQTLARTINGELRTQDAPFVARSLLMSVYGREAAWEFVKTNWETMERQYPKAGLRRLAEGVTGLATPELAFYEEFTATENLVFAAEARGLAAPPRAAAAALERVGLGTRSADRVGAFSSGMKQRLRLAFALLHEPAILLLDEPGSHLDESGREAVRDVVARHAARGLVLLATNDPEEIQLAERHLELHGHGLGDPA